MLPVALDQHLANVTGLPKTGILNRVGEKIFQND